MSETTQVAVNMSPEEYLAGELTAEIRSEYVGGQAYPMPGVSANHDTLSNNLKIDLGVFVEGTPCQVRGPDLKLRSDDGNVYYYPDLMICCDPSDAERYWRDRPRYVFEVSSPETWRTDDREKKIAYFHIESIESYLQVAQDTIRVVINRRAPAADYWVEEILTHPDDELRLDSLGFSVPLRRVYRRTGLPGAD